MNKGLIKVHKACLARNLPFVTFRLPQQEHPITYIQTSKPEKPGSLHELSSSVGFLMAPFDPRNGHELIFIHPDLKLSGEHINRDSIRTLEALPLLKPQGISPHVPYITGRDPYIAQVKKIQSSIANGAFQKAVLSRIQLVEGDHQDLVPKLYQVICRKHPNAFTYLIRSGEHFWMGASPEPLLRLSQGKVSTVSLAGTRPYASRHMHLNKWTPKEILEQEYVTHYIHDVLRSFGVKDYRVSSPYVKKAGNLLHLRTDFTMSHVQLNGHLWDFIEAMHPTPAVAGQPKTEAIDFIKDLEPHDREYYTGFLGPVNGEKELDLFVNLRCLRICPEHLALYVGGGITLESEPSEEWNETQLKAQSLLKILAAYIKDLVL